MEFLRRMREGEGVSLSTTASRLPSLTYICKMTPVVQANSVLESYKQVSFIVITKPRGQKSADCKNTKLTNKRSRAIFRMRNKSSWLRIPETFFWLKKN